MSKVAVVYWSSTGNTEEAANLVAEGIRNAGGEADVFTATDFSEDKADEYSVFALGCPAMGDEELEDSEFQPMYDAIKGKLSGKIVALFGTYGWGDGAWMDSWKEDCAGTGAQMPFDPVICQEMPEGDDAQAFRDLGAKLAK